MRVCTAKIKIYSVYIHTYIYKETLCYVYIYIKKHIAVTRNGVKYSSGVFFYVQVVLVFQHGKGKPPLEPKKWSPSLMISAGKKVHLHVKVRGTIIGQF